MKKILFLILLMLPIIVLAQDLRLNNNGTTSSARIGDNKTVVDKREKPPITEHREAIKKYGLTKYHRKSFKLLPNSLPLKPKKPKDNP